MPHIEQVDDRAEGPGDRVDPDREHDVVIDPADGQERHHTHGTPAGQHDHRRDDRLSDTAHDRGAYVRKAAEAEEQAAGLAAQCPVADDLRI